jgi:hypothetical protein
VLHGGSSQEGVEQRLQLRKDVLELSGRERLLELRAESVKLCLEVGLRVGLRLRSGLRSRLGNGLRRGLRNRSLRLRWGRLRSRSLSISLEVELDDNCLWILGTSQRVSLEELVVGCDRDEVAVVIFILYSEIGWQLLEESLEKSAN